MSAEGVVVVVVAFYGDLEKTNLRIIYFPPLGHPLAHHRQGKDLFLKRYGFSRMIVMDLYLFYDFKRLRSIQQASKSLLNEIMKLSGSDLLLRWAYEEAPEAPKSKSPEFWRPILESIFQL